MGEDTHVQLCLITDKYLTIKDFNKYINQITIS